MDRVTCVIKTFERPHRCIRLIESIRKYYPSVPILVVDDSEQPLTCSDATIIALPFDSGISKGRNVGVASASTEFVLLMDDDYVFREATQIEKLVAVLERNPAISICAGHVENSRCNEFSLAYEDGDLIFRPQPISCHLNFDIYDVTENFFLGRRADILANPWDEHLPVAYEHTDFFLGLKKSGRTVAFCREVEVMEPRSENPDRYKHLRAQKNDPELLRTMNAYIHSKHQTKRWLMVVDGRLRRVR